MRKFVETAASITSTVSERRTRFYCVLLKVRARWAGQCPPRARPTGHANPPLCHQLLILATLQEALKCRSGSVERKMCHL